MIKKIFLILILMSMINIVNAETGIINVISEQDFSYNPAGSQVPTKSTNFSVFYFDITDYHKISRYTITTTISPVVAPLTNSSYFTINTNTGNIGRGYFWYDAYNKNMTWSFSDDTYIASNPVYITYSSPEIFEAFGTDINGYVGATSMSDAPTTTSPIYLSTTDNQQLYKFGSALYTVNWHQAYFVGTNTSIDYNITYPLSGQYNAFIKKYSNRKDSKIVIHSKTITQYTDGTANNFNVNHTNYTLDGLYINVSMVSGGFNDVLINSSGILPESYNLQFNKSMYALGESVGLIYNISNPDTTASYYLKVFQCVIACYTWNHYIFPISNGGIDITSDINKNLKSSIYIAIVKNGIEMFYSPTIHYGEVDNISQVNGNFSIDKYSYNIGETMNITYNASFVGRFYSTCSQDSIDYTNGLYMIRYSYQPKDYPDKCILKMQFDYLSTWVDLETHEYKVLNFTNNTYFDKNYYSLGDEAIIYYSSTDNMNTISMKDSNNKVIFNYSADNTSTGILNKKYTFKSYDVVGSYTIFLNDSLHNILSTQSVNVNDAIIVIPQPTISTSQPTSLLDVGNALSEVVVGKQTDENGIVSDIQIKKTGNSIYGLLLAVVFICLMSGTYYTLINEKRR